MLTDVYRQWLFYQSNFDVKLIPLSLAMVITASAMHRLNRGSRLQFFQPVENKKLGVPLVHLVAHHRYAPSDIFATDCL
jgi:hypothetical protein